MRQNRTEPKRGGIGPELNGKRRLLIELLLPPLAAAVSLVAPGGASAEGFRNPPSSTFALGRAGGRIAHIDDSSAAQQNPANLVDVGQAEAQITPTVADLIWDFDSAAAPGQSARTESTWKLLPNLFASVPLKDNQMALGLGVTTPYGIGSEWDKDTSAFARPMGVLRYQSAYNAKLMTINCNPSVAVRLNDHIQLGAGLDVMWSELTLKQFYPWFMMTGDMNSPDGHAEAKADGLGWGGNLGLTIKLAERHSLALTYRSSMDVAFNNGDFTVDNVPPALGGGSIRSDFSSRIKFPSIFAAGYGVQVSDKVRLEVDAEFIKFSDFNKLPLTLGLPARQLIPYSSVPENWKDTFTIGIGGDWEFAPNWVVRASYQYYESPVPDSTFTPMIVDANQNVVTVGVGYHGKRHRLELAYSPVFYETRNIRTSYNPAFNGKYEVTLHLFSVSYRLTF
jgi:long-chain fatty acid transport protein